MFLRVVNLMMFNICNVELLTCGSTNHIKKYKIEEDCFYFGFSGRYLAVR